MPRSNAGQPKLVLCLLQLFTGIFGGCRRGFSGARCLSPNPLTASRMKGEPQDLTSWELSADRTVFTQENIDILM